MDWNIFEQTQPGAAKPPSDERLARQIPGAGDTMEERHLRLALVCRAVWELCSAQLGLTEDQLLEKIAEIDLRDGRADGVDKAPLTCSQCQRPVSGRHAKCMYCGGDIPRTGFDMAR
jgi:hypothetical protein